MHEPLKPEGIDGLDIDEYRHGQDDLDPIPERLHRSSNLPFPAFTNGGRNIFGRYRRPATSSDCEWLAYSIPDESRFFEHRSRVVANKRLTSNITAIGENRTGK